jgi:hypothetical protein
MSRSSSPCPRVCATKRKTENESMPLTVTCPLAVATTVIWQGRWAHPGKPAPLWSWHRDECRKTKKARVYVSDFGRKTELIASPHESRQRKFGSEALTEERESLPESMMTAAGAMGTFGRMSMLSSPRKLAFESLARSHISGLR